MGINSSIATSKLLRKEYPLTFQHAASGFPEGVTFAKDEFVRPLRHTPSGVALLSHASTMALATMSESAVASPITILDTTASSPAIHGEVE